jgi:hypothetical protein
MTIGPLKHRNLPLGYIPGKLPTFVTPPATAEELVIAHGSCRRPYAEGTDAIVAVDQIIQRSIENPVRPHYLFLTGDQIYADDLSETLLGWANDVGIQLVGKNGAHALEQLRVEIPTQAYEEAPDKVSPATDAATPKRLVSFPADRNHFPPGRRARLCSRAANLTSDDNRNHALSFGEISAHYLMSWANVCWPKNLEDATTWKSIYADRGVYVRSYLDAWRDTMTKAKQRWAQLVAADPSYSIDKNAKLPERLAYVDGYNLLPSEYRGIDRFADPAINEWWTYDPANPESANSRPDKPWNDFWTTAPASQWLPAPRVAVGIATTSTTQATDFVGTPDDLTGLWRLMTPSWYAGYAHFTVELDDYKVNDPAPDLPALENLVIKSDKVLVDLGRLRDFYQGLPNVRRALANCSTLMMFDDHEVTDDWDVTANWLQAVRSSALGRDMITNAMAAYLLFQDWGNDHAKYLDSSTSPNRAALKVIKRMFVGVVEGPAEQDREELEQYFGYTNGSDGELPLTEQASWAFSITDPNVSPYEIVLLDNRTKRGYDTPDDPPADLSIEAIATQIKAEPPQGSTVTIVIAPLPVVGYPPIEEIVQPILNLYEGTTSSHNPQIATRQLFPSIQRDYLFGTLISDPEAWSFNTRAQEELFARISSRPAVVFLSGDIHFSLTSKVTYWRKDDTNALAPVSRFAQLISSALKNVPPEEKRSMATLGIVEQLGAVIAGPVDRLGWASGGVDGPNFDTTGASWQLVHRMNKNPAVIPVRMLPDPVVAQLRKRQLAHPPEWAWRFELVKDLRPDADRYTAMSGSTQQFELPTEAQLAADPRSVVMQIATHHVWHAEQGMTRRTFFPSNVGIVTFRHETADETSPLVVVHTLYAWDRSNLGPGGGGVIPNKPWPEARLAAQPYVQYYVSFDLHDQLAPDRPEPT